MATKKEKDSKIEELEPKVEKKEQESSKTEKSEEKVFVYIGPSIDGFLMQNTTLRGQKEQIKEHFSSIFEKYPKIEHLFIPVEKLGATKIKGALKQYYEQTKELIRR